MPDLLCVRKIKTELRCAGCGKNISKKYWSSDIVELSNKKKEEDYLNPAVVMKVKSMNDKEVLVDIYTYFIERPEYEEMKGISDEVLSKYEVQETTLDKALLLKGIVNDAPNDPSNPNLFIVQILKK